MGKNKKKILRVGGIILLFFLIMLIDFIFFGKIIFFLVSNSWWLIPALIASDVLYRNKGFNFSKQDKNLFILAIILFFLFGISFLAKYLSSVI